MPEDTLVSRLEGLREKAETAWGQGNIVQSAAISRLWQDFYADANTWDTITGCEELLVTFLKIFRVYVDASKTLINRMWFPRRIYRRLTRVITEITQVTGSKTVQGKVASGSDALRTVYAESLRDFAKVLVCFSALLSGYHRQLVLKSAELVLESVVELLGTAHQTAILSGIELFLIRSERGGLTVSEGSVLSDRCVALFTSIYQSNHKRAGAVAIWMIVYPLPFDVRLLGLLMFAFLYMSRDKTLFGVLVAEIRKQAAKRPRHLWLLLVKHIPFVGVSHRRLVKLIETGLVF